MTTKSIIVLFDESGTPSITNCERSDWFLGVGVAYDQAYEDDIFSKSNSLFALRKNRPLKNDRMRNSRAIGIANLLVDLPVSVVIARISLLNRAFHKTIVAYERFGEIGRREFRRARKRPIPQIIHSQILDNCLFHLITRHFESCGGDAAFSIFIDNWSIPKKDLEISLIYRAKSLHQKISSLCQKLSNGRLISIDPLKLLIHDSSRKRFVDAVASTVSRAYLKETDPKFLNDPLDILVNRGKTCCIDITQHVIDIMQEVSLPDTLLSYSEADG
jgi:hypothetical protein